MTHPLTPREKVELKPCPFCGSSAILERNSDHHGGWFNLGCGAPWKEGDACPGYHAFYTCDPSEETAAVAAWNHRAALASPGDHAELARLAETNKAYGFLVQVKPSDLLALIAEVAALRSAKWEVQHVDTMNDMVLMGMARDAAEARATEAERKLAEAVGLLGDVVFVRRDNAGQSAEYMLSEVITKARIFLSKEAERG